MSHGKELEAKLTYLSPDHLVAFAALCCERLIPNYHRFYEVHGWGNPSELRTLLDMIWGHISGARLPADRILEFRERCSLIIPDSEDFDDILVSHAIDAGSAVHEGLELCLNAGVEHAITIAGLARDTVDMHIQERDDMDYTDPSFEAKILEDPLMRREILRQHGDLDLLLGHATADAALVRLLRTKYAGASNLDPI